MELNQNIPVVSEEDEEIKHMQPVEVVDDRYSEEIMSVSYNPYSIQPPPREEFSNPFMSPSKVYPVANSDEEMIVKVENVHKTYLIGIEGVAALRGVTISVKKGELLCILGMSGGGKTTLMNIMGTIDRPTKGHVTLCNEKIRESTQDKILANLRLRKLAFVFQTFNLISSMTALENVELPMLLLGVLSRRRIKEKATMLLEKVGLSHRLGHYPNMLSGGEQQRVTIARALANDPELLLLDEPTGDLDTKNTEIVMKILLDLNREGKTLIMVTHDVALKHLGHRVVQVLDGKIIRCLENTEEERQAAIASLGEGTSQLRTGTNFILTPDMPTTQYRTPNDYPALRDREFYV